MLESAMRVFLLIKEAYFDGSSEVIDVFMSRYHAELAAEALVGKPVAQNSKGQVDGWEGHWSKYDFEIEEHEMRGE